MPRLTSDHGAKLTGVGQFHFRKMRQRGQLPGLKIGVKIEPFDILMATIAGAFQQDYGFDRDLCVKIVVGGRRVLRSLAYRLDENPETQAFFAAGADRTRNVTDFWCVVGPEATVSQTLGNPPGRGAYERVCCVDVGRLARQIRARAAEHDIELERFTRDRETFGDVDFSASGSALQ